MLVGWNWTRAGVVAAVIGVAGVLWMHESADSVAHSATAPIVLSGTVLDAFGRPASGAAVYLYVLRDAGSANEASLATTSADGSGSWTLTAKPTASTLAVANDNGGYVNFEVDILTGGAQSSQFFSKRWSGGAWVNGSATPVDL